VLSAILADVAFPAVQFAAARSPFRVEQAPKAAASQQGSG